MSINDGLRWLLLVPGVPDLYDCVLWKVLFVQQVLVIGDM